MVFYSLRRKKFVVILKVVSTGGTSDDSLSPKKVLYRRARWSGSAALQSLVVAAINFGMAAYVSVTYSVEAANASPRDSIMLFIVGAVLSIILGGIIYSLAREQNFISAICKQYGYTLESLAESIPETSAKNSHESRMLLPVSPTMDSNVDIFVRRTKAGIFVEEIHHAV